jgi:hypothetical protein
MKPGFQNDNVLFKLPKLERNCQKSKEFQQELSPRCFDLEEVGEIATNKQRD